MIYLRFLLVLIVPIYSGTFLTGGLAHTPAGMVSWRHLSIMIGSGSERSPSLLNWSSAKSSHSTDLHVFLVLFHIKQTDRYPPSLPKHWAKMGSEGALRMACFVPAFKWTLWWICISISITPVKCSLNVIYRFLFTVLEQVQISPAGHLLCYYIISAIY